ncbi:MAG: sel1 repeat family protein [Acetobacteraceae bacterium]|nr:sel1 repeat family protein [Acetobacteraceae bacterium]
MPPGIAIRTRILAALGQPEAQLALAKIQSGPRASIEAIQLIAAAARAGLPEAQARLGLCYLNGHGVPANQAEARHWLERAADAGDATAQTELASLALRGVSGLYERGPFSDAEPSAPDHHLAAELARRAAKTGSAEAQALLAYILNVAPSTADGPGEADALYQQSAATGWPLGQLGHAMTLLKRATPEAAREAMALLTEAAASGLPTAHFLLGALAESGAVGAVEPRSAVTHYRAGAARGHTGSKIRLGLALMTGRGTARDVEEAETWLRRAAQDGDVTAAAILGDFHASPDRRPPNLGEAAIWYRRAADLGHGGAAHALARAIAAGAEGHPDPREVAAWLQAAVERGETAAWRDIGLAVARAGNGNQPMWDDWLYRMIREGRAEGGYYAGIRAHDKPGGRAGEIEARRHYLWAASHGMIEAMAAGAEMLLNGRGGPADPDLARALFEYAAKRGHAGAHFALGVMAGNEPDRAAAHFRQAADLGHPRAMIMVESAAA